MILNSKLQLSALFVIALMIASAVLLAEPAKAQTEEFLNRPHGGQPSGLIGDPNLGPLPAGVTPQYTIEQTAYMSLTPNPLGQNQQLLVNVWTSPGMYHSFYGFGYVVEIIKPDGTNQTIGPFNSYLGDDTAWFIYTPDQVGTYKFKFQTPGTWIPAGQYYDLPGSTTGGFGAGGQFYNLGASVYYTPCSTDWQNVTVQTDFISSWPAAHMPTSYWREPISPMNREWATILSYYPWNGAIYYDNGRVWYPSNYRLTPYVQGPSTAHVVWRRQGAIGGLQGIDQGYYSYTAGGGNPNIIFQGRAYQTYTAPPQLTNINGTWAANGNVAGITMWVCYDLRTGQVFWQRPLAAGETAPTDVIEEAPVSSFPGAEVSNAPSLSLITITAPTTTSTSGVPTGGTPGRIIKYNPYTGAVLSNVTGVPIGCTVARPGIVSPSGEYGSILFNYTQVYSFQTVNSTAGLYRLIKWSAAGTSTNFTTRILSNITVPNKYTPTALSAIDYNAGVSVAVQWANPPGAQWCIGINMTAIDINTGDRLWDYATNDSVTNNIQTLSSPVADWGKVAVAMQNRHWSCFDLRTGAKVWDSDLTGYPWGNWWAYATASYDFNSTFGEIIACAYDGLYALDWNTGKILWHFSDPSVPFESPYGYYPFFTGVRMADGKIYAYSGEHTASEPITRGWSIYCVDAINGSLIWKMQGPMAVGPVADGYLATSCTYDGYTYIFGKGQSQTTVSASVASGSGITISGTVMDMSPGDQGSWINPTALLDSPTKQGTIPCVSAASLATQMQYLYEQQPIDGIWHNETLVGVPVILTAIGSDSSVIDLGTVTTNGYYGTFSYHWTPPKADTYTITADFAGDGSYGSSSGAVALSVGAAASTTPAPSQTPPTSSNVATTADLMTWIIIAAVAIIIAIAIATALILRKH